VAGSGSRLGLTAATASDQPASATPHRMLDLVEICIAGIVITAEPS
jgi:hypothetical protein